ncbi:MAG TPA: GNAT family protein, partial [Planctomycetia bacterium]|nr:GNAT family protein [Planctomycetia bacterium]
IEARLAALRADREQSPRRRFQLKILDAATEAFLGAVSLERAESDFSQAWLAYGIVPERRGARFAEEAARALLDHARAALGVVDVRATCAAGNAASLQVLRKLGFWREGWMRALGPDGAEEDRLLFRRRR